MNLERGIRLMIEIIREDKQDSTQEKKVLPKNIKQIGTPDIGDRIYIENQPYQRMHPYGSVTEKAAYVMLGRFENLSGRQCTFIEAVIELEEIHFEGNLPAWNDDTWAYIYKKLKKEYEEMVIVGWAMDIRGHLPNMTAPLEKLHRSYFAGAHQLLFLMDTLEHEEAFYGLRNGYLSRREGYYVYYDKTIPDIIEDAIKSFDNEEIKENSYQETSIQKEPEIEQKRGRFRESLSEDGHANAGEKEMRDWNAQGRSGVYREILRKEEEGKPFFPSYVTTFLLIAVAGALCFSAFKNYQKMNAMEETLALMNSTQTTMTEETESTAVMGSTESLVQVGQIEGNVAKNTETEQTTEAQSGNDTGTQSGATETNGQPAETDTQGNGTEQGTGVSNGMQTETGNSTQTDATTPAAETMTEAQTYLAQGYYVVQKGDSLVGICQKIYQTTAMLDKLCEANGIEDPDAIYAGQYLTLPN